MTKDLRKLLDAAARDVATAQFMIEGIDVRIAQVVRARFSYIAQSVERGLRAEHMVMLLLDPPGLPLSYVQSCQDLIEELGLERAIAVELVFIEIYDGAGAHLLGRPL
ncbi:MAG: hypothetical protein WD929_09585 [Steroidobacteraceae bacterium]